MVQHEVAVGNDTLSLPSASMTATDLAAAVERAAAGMSMTTLQRQTGLSARTLRELLRADTGRRFNRSTLDKLDGPLGWAPGTAWRHYRASETRPSPVADAVMVQMQQLAARLESIEERPPWAAEMIDACRLLSAEDRAIVLALARRLSRL